MLVLFQPGYTSHAPAIHSRIHNPNSYVFNKQSYECVLNRKGIITLSNISLTDAYDLFGEAAVNANNYTLLQCHRPSVLEPLDREPPLQDPSLSFPLRFLRAQSDFSQFFYVNSCIHFGVIIFKLLLVGFLPKG